MTRSPILKALSSIRLSGAKTLLMGGQACVFYGAAEFSRDLDLLLLIEPENLDRFQGALQTLEAKPIAVPPFDSAHLARGHAIHFRCQREDVPGLRIDVMSVLRGVAPFDELWERRVTIEVEGIPLDLLDLEDLVRAKKTQRDKDWPMIRRLVERSYFTQHESPTRERFWLLELRTPELLMQAAATFPDMARELEPLRPLLKFARGNNPVTLEDLLEQEEREERQKDRDYWDPLKKELEQIRRSTR